MMTVQDFIVSLAYDKGTNTEAIRIHDMDTHETIEYNVKEVPEKVRRQFVVSFNLGKDKIYELIVATI